MMQTTNTSNTTPSQKPSWYQRVKSVLFMASQAILAAPVKLPVKVLTAARYLAMVIGLLDAIDRQLSDEEETSGEPRRSSR